MAALTRGVSFRRQGSSGLSWTDTWSFNEEGALVRNTKEEAYHSNSSVHVRSFGGPSLSRIHDLQDDSDGEDGEGEGEGKGKGSSSSSSSDMASDGIGNDGSAGDGHVQAAGTAQLPADGLHFSRSKSAGSVGIPPNAAPIHSQHSTGSAKPRAPQNGGAARLLNWFKKTFGKSKK